MIFPGASRCAESSFCLSSVINHHQQAAQDERNHRRLIGARLLPFSVMLTVPPPPLQPGEHKRRLFPVILLICSCSTPAEFHSGFSLSSSTILLFSPQAGVCFCFSPPPLLSALPLSLCLSGNRARALERLLCLSRTGCDNCHGCMEVNEILNQVGHVSGIMAHQLFLCHLEL